MGLESSPGGTAEWDGWREEGEVAGRAVVTVVAGVRTGKSAGVGECPSRSLKGE